MPCSPASEPCSGEVQGQPGHFSLLSSPSSPSSASEHSYSLGSAFARSKGGLQVSADHPPLGRLWGLNPPNSCSCILAGFDPEAAKTTELAECCVLQSSEHMDGVFSTEERYGISILHSSGAQHRQGRTFVFLHHPCPEAVPGAPGAGDGEGTASTGSSSAVTYRHGIPAEVLV